MKLSPEEAWAGTLESMVDNRVVFYLKRYNRDYQDYSRQMKELCEKYPAIIQLIDGNNGVTLNDEEYQVFKTYSELSSNREMLERAYYYYFGQADMFHYQKLLKEMGFRRESDGCKTAFSRREGAAGKNRSNLDGVDQSAGEADGIAEKWKICGTKGYDLPRISGDFADDRKDGYTDRANDGCGGSGYAESAGKRRISPGSGRDLSGDRDGSKPCREYIFTAERLWIRDGKRMKERKEKMRKGIKKYSPGIGKKSKNKNKGSLQAACEKTRRVSLCSFRAVLTVEAAFVVPLFLLAICTLLGMIDLYRVQALVRTSLHQSAQELGMYASVESGDSGVSTPVGVLSTGICIAYTKSHLPELGDYVSVNLIGSRYENHEIQLKATITYQLPFSILPVSKIKVGNGSVVHAWTGYDSGDTGKTDGGDGDEMVYVSDYESVYHTSVHCTHLDLSIHQGTKEQVERQRNEYGKKYHACERCGGDSHLVYYTEKGDRYHSEASCSGLKRTVRLVEKSQIQAHTQCERCRGTGK